MLRLQQELDCGSQMMRATPPRLAIAGRVSALACLLTAHFVHEAKLDEAGNTSRTAQETVKPLAPAHRAGRIGRAHA